MYFFDSYIFDKFYSTGRFQDTVDSDYADEISCDQEPSPTNDGTKTVTISMENYKRLLKASVDLYKAKDVINVRNDRIEQLKKEVSILKEKTKNMERLSIVSCYIITIHSTD